MLVALSEVTPTPALSSAVEFIEGHYDGKSTIFARLDWYRLSFVCKLQFGHATS